MTGRIRGVSVDLDQGRQSAIALEKDSNGIHWSISADHIEDQQTAVDCHRLRKDQCAEGNVFYADTIANKHVLLALKKQPFRRYKGSDGALVRTVERLRNAAEGSAWQTAALQQTPTHLWLLRTSSSHRLSSLSRLLSNSEATKSRPSRPKER